MSIAQTLRGGGVERALLRLAAGWAESGRRVTLLIGERGGPLTPELSPAIEVIELGTPAFSALSALPEMVRDLRPSLIFCPGNHYTGFAGLTRLRLGRDAPPIVAKISNALRRRDHSFPLALAYRWWVRRHPAFIDHFVAMTEAMRTEAITTMKVNSSRTSVIANPPAPIGLSIGGLPLEHPLLLGVGRLENQKRWDRLIDAMPYLADKRTRLMILGEGNMRRALEAQIAALGLNDRVTLPGYVSDATPFIAQAAALALTSDFEGVPGVLVEALSMGTPVVTTDSSVAVREIIRVPAQGHVVPVGDAPALVNALNYWLTPDVKRPLPTPPAGGDSVVRYLNLFDRLVAQRQFMA